MTSRTRRVVSIAAIAAAGLTAGAVGATAPPAGEAPVVTLNLVAEFDTPVDLAWRDGDPGMYVVQKGGQILRFADDTATPVLDIGDLVSGGSEQGLLGLVFAPAGDVAYINYTDTNGDTNVVELAVDGEGVFDQESMRPILLVEQPYENHNGGDLAFGPDGMLYIGLGDGGAGGDPERRAQDLGSLLGKMLRIDPAEPSTVPAGELPYTIPDDNPFVGQNGARAEIWSVGLRNPWRYAFDAETGDLWIADVGQNATEEIDVAPADADGRNAGLGLNFGWSGFEGDDVFNEDVVVEGHHPPIYTYPHDGRCSVSGGVRARGDAAGELAGWYVFADYCSGQVFALPVSGEGESLAAAGEAVELATANSVTAVLGAPSGELYVLDATGVHRIDAA